MKSLIKSIDIYGKQFNFFVDEYTSHKTFIGGVFTLISLAVFFITVFYISENFYNKKNPFISNERISLNKYPIYNVSNINFLFGFRIENDYGNTLTETDQYFSFQVIYHNIKIKRKNNV